MKIDVKQWILEESNSGLTAVASNLNSIFVKK